MTATSPVAACPSAREFTRELLRRVDTLDAGLYARLFAPTALDHRNAEGLIAELRVFADLGPVLTGRNAP